MRIWALDMPPACACRRGACTLPGMAGFRRRVLSFAPLIATLIRLEQFSGTLTIFLSAVSREARAASGM
ncbi:MAG: hypothetical protein J7457_04465 [Roseiflexus sp.]|nr:hypothetical protein [Roseiflexus sp.]